MFYRIAQYDHGRLISFKEFDSKHTLVSQRQQGQKETTFFKKVIKYSKRSLEVQDIQMAEIVLFEKRQRDGNQNFARSSQSAIRLWQKL